MGGIFKKGKKQSNTSSTSTETVPAWLTDASQDVIGRAKGIADRPWEGYQGDPVAGLSADEQSAIDLQRTHGSDYQPLYNKAEDATDKANTSWLDADRQAYMNPYAEAALEPAANALRKEGAQNVRDAGAQAGMAGAFGGSRATLLQTETANNTQKNISNLYEEGFAKNYEDAYSKFNGDRENFRQIADQYQSLGTSTQDAIHQEMSDLMANGNLDRNLRQAGINFDINQFREARDWDVNNLQPLLNAINGAAHNTTTTSNATDTEKGGSGGLSDILGLASTAFGLYEKYKNLGGKGLFGGVGDAAEAGGSFDPPTNAPGG